MPVQHVMTFSSMANHRTVSQSLCSHCLQSFADEENLRTLGRKGGPMPLSQRQQRIYQQPHAGHLALQRVKHAKFCFHPV